MARVTHVKRAQQRYKTVPVIDQETGQQKTIPVIRKDGTPKMTRTKPNRPGRPITRKLTQDDKTQPLPNRKCGKCGKEIEVGQPYKWIQPKSGPYGGSKRYRCAACPNWQVWEYSSSMSARVAQITYEFEQAISSVTSPDEVTEPLSNTAEEIRSLAEEKRDGASNIESGFGHSTSQSEELESIADELEGWAGDVESVDVPELPDPEEVDCEDCEGIGEVEGTEEDRHETYGVPQRKPCVECEGTGKVTPDEPTEEQMESWLQEVQDACSAVDECPV